MSKKQLSPKLFACSQSMGLAEKIAKEYGVPLGKVKTTKFSDGEFQPAFEESVRGRRVFIIGSTFPTADNLMEMLLMLDAAKRASARHITAVMPYFGWARQDRKDQPRVAIGAKLVANLLQAALKHTKPLSLSWSIRWQTKAVITGCASTGSPWMRKYSKSRSP